MTGLLIVVDYQNDFVDGALGFEGADLLDKKIAARIREYGSGNVIFTRDTHSVDYLDTREGKHLPIPHCIKGTHGHEVYGETKKALEEVGAAGFDKEAFGLRLNDEIRKSLPASPDTIEIAGLVSNICVLSNAVIFQTEYPQAQIVVDAELTASFDGALNEKTLDVLEGLQVNVLNRKKEA